MDCIQTSEAPRAGGVDVSRAHKIIEESICEVGREQAGVINAFGRTLAADVQAGNQVPCRDTAAIEGYAASALDTACASDKDPCVLSVLADRVRPDMKLLPGTLVRIHRGEQLPGGADTVIPMDHVYRPDDGPRVLVMTKSARHDNVHLAGSIIAAGDTLLRKGTVVTGREMAVLATLGSHGVEVSRKPRVGIITTGSNVVDVVEELGSGQVRNSARYALVGGVLEAGCDIGRLMHIKTGRVGIERALGECATCDAQIVALAAGERHEIAVAALANRGRVHFERVHMEPGAASAYGTVDGKPVFLTPADAIVEAFEAFIRSALLRMLAREIVHRPKVRAALRGSLRLSPGYAHFIKAATTLEEDGHAAEPLPSHRPEMRPWAQPNSLIYVPPNTEAIKRGDLVDVVMLG